MGGGGGGYFGGCRINKACSKILLFENWCRQLKTVTPEILAMPQNYIKVPVQRGSLISLS